MSLYIDISIDLAEALEGLKQLDSKEVYRAARRAANRTLLTLRKESINLLRQEINLKPGKLRDKYIWLEKAKGASAVEAAICFSSQPVPLLDFVRGSQNKSTDDQKGVPVKRRKKLRVEIVPGKRFTMKRAFIQRVKSKQVFNRTGPKGPFKAQSTPSIGAIVMSRKRGVGDALVDIGQRRFAELFTADLEARLNKRFKTGPSK